MLWRTIEANGGKLPADTMVLFGNTGKERSETLDFIHEVETRWDVPVAWLEYRRRNHAHEFERVTYETASRNGEPFDQLLGFMNVLPNTRVRACTAELKIRTIKRYIQSLGHTTWFDAIGIRADEVHREAKVRAGCPKYITPLFPLIVGNVTEKEVMAFWAKQPFDLQLRQYEGNCDLCFLKSRGKIAAIMRDKPELAGWWIEKEREAKERFGEGGGSVFRADRPSYAHLFAQMKEQPSMFGDEDQVQCACTDGGIIPEEVDGG
jgi:3'-phosphoadenosine 5'-phosphosulfate sulfotransferase (PAPS reductase)/FAD synthetase